MKLLKNITLAGIALLATTSFSQAAVILNWIDWTAPGSYPFSNSDALSYTYATGTTGSITMPDTSVVGVTLSGEILNPANFGSSGFGISGSSYWDTRNYSGNTYISANVPNLPDNSDRIAVAGYGIATQTLTFGSSVSNIVMNIWSLGNPTTLGSWRFNQPFVILSQNTGQYPAAPYALQAASNNTLNGYEGSGTIQFTGSFSSLSWEVLHPEVYAVWNIGVTSASAAAVPEPGQVAASLLLLGGIGAFVFVKRRKALKNAPSMA